MSDNSSMTEAGIDRAALAFSLLPANTAEVVNRRLSVGERMRLREGLARMRDASDARRMAAIRSKSQSRFATSRPSRAKCCGKRSPPKPVPPCWRRSTRCTS
jgi:hypothetical protein